LLFEDDVSAKVFMGLFHGAVMTSPREVQTRSNDQSV